MVDRITKHLLKFSTKEQKEIQKLITLILQNQLTGLDVKKLKGREDTYRVRKGTICVIFCKTTTDPHIIAIEHRGDHTY